MSALIDRLTTEQGYPVAKLDTIDDLVAANDFLVLFFTNDPARCPESNDVAVILPELQWAFQNRFQVAVVDRESEQALKKRYPFNQWPALVVLQRGIPLEVISRVRDWAEYRAILGPLLVAGSQSEQPISNTRLS